MCTASYSKIILKKVHIFSLKSQLMGSLSSQSGEGVVHLASFPKLVTQDSSVTQPFKMHVHVFVQEGKQFLVKFLVFTHLYSQTSICNHLLEVTTGDLNFPIIVKF